MCFPRLRTDATSTGPKVTGDEVREKFSLAQTICLIGTVGSALACKAGDPGSNPGPGEDFFNKLTHSAYQTSV